MTFAVTMEVGRLSRGTHFVGPIAIATMVAWLGHLDLDLDLDGALGVVEFRAEQNGKRTTQMENQQTSYLLRARTACCETAI